MHYVTCRKLWYLVTSKDNRVTSVSIFTIQAVKGNADFHVPIQMHHVLS